MNTLVFRALILIGTLVVIPISHASAATFIAPKGESASVRSEVADDLYAASNAVVIAAPVHGDIFTAGDSVDISGSSDASVFAIGRDVTISGSVKDDVRVAGNSISITSDIAHDAFVGGSTIFIGPDSIIGKDAYIAGSEVVIAGNIRGDVRVASEHVTIAKTAIITGNLTTYQYSPVIEDGAKIMGKVTTTTAPIRDARVERGSAIGSLAKSATSRALFALLLVWIAPLFIQTTLSHAKATPGASGLIGLGMLIAILPLTLILAITGIGVHVAAFVFIAVILCMVLGAGVSTMFIGSFLMQLLGKKDSPLWHRAIIGSIAASIVDLLGGIGLLVLFVFFLIALGSASKTLKEKLYG